MTADAADLASRIAERLPAPDVRQLARVAADGQEAVRALRARVTAPVLRDACDQLLRQLAGQNAGYVAGLLAGAACAVERGRQRQSVDVVWTGPESGS